MRSNRRTLFETERALGETDAQSSSPDARFLRLRIPLALVWGFWTFRPSIWTGGTGPLPGWQLSTRRPAISAVHDKWAKRPQVTKADSPGTLRQHHLINGRSVMIGPAVRRRRNRD